MHAQLCATIVLNIPPPQHPTQNPNLAVPETNTATYSIIASSARRNLPVHGLFRQDSKARLGRFAERKRFLTDVEGGRANLNEGTAEDSDEEGGTDAMIGVDARFSRDDVAVVVDKIRPKITRTGSECQRVRSRCPFFSEEYILGHCSRLLLFPV